MNHPNLFTLRSYEYLVKNRNQSQTFDRFCRHNFPQFKVVVKSNESVVGMTSVTPLTSMTTPLVDWLATETFITN